MRSVLEGSGMTGRRKREETGDERIENDEDHDGGIVTFTPGDARRRNFSVLRTLGEILIYVCIIITTTTTTMFSLLLQLILRPPVNAI
jgi:hypothetical protein